MGRKELNQTNKTSNLANLKFWYLLNIQVAKTLWQACTNVRSRQIIVCQHTMSREIDEGSS